MARGEDVLDDEASRSARRVRRGLSAWLGLWCGGALAPATVPVRADDAKPVGASPPDAKARAPVGAPEAREAKARSGDTASPAAAPSPRHEPAQKSFVDEVTWPVGQGAKILYDSTANAAGLLEREQVVPRMKKLLHRQWGSIGLYPTFTIQSTRQYRAVPGLRMVSQSGPYATTLFGQFGGAEAYELESRLRIAATVSEVPAVLSLEGYHERYLYWYAGLGQSPFSDPRNVFVGAPRKVYYREHKERALASLGFRPTADGDIELFLSSSIQQRTIDDPDDPGAGTLREVFAPESRLGSYRTTRLSYTEAAVRLDTRESRAGPMPGWLAEVYGGFGFGLQRETTQLARLGWMSAYFLDVGGGHVVSPRVTFDATQPLEGTTIPFEELPVQPAFRAPGDRRDYFSAVFSLDARRRITEAVAARVFGDVARVAPSLLELRPTDLRLGAGAAVDFFSKGAEVGQAGAAVGQEGIRFFLSIGARSPFSDRQHRD